MAGVVGVRAGASAKKDIVLEEVFAKCHHDLGEPWLGS
jgi:hypothetical protein